LIAKLVGEVDYHSVTNDSLDPWYGPLSIDPNDRPMAKAIGIPGHPTHTKIVCASFGVNERG
jgi:hypothetical protein